MYRFFLSILFVATLLFTVVTPSHAQFGLEDLESLTSSMGIDPTSSFGQISPGINAQFNGLTLIPYPDFPEPFTDFEIELSAPDSRYNGAQINWFINGEELSEARNKRKNSFTAGPLGEAMEIEARLRRNDGQVESVYHTITPVKIDIVIEGITEIPHFYKGRPLPSRESEVRANAIITTGSTINRTSLGYDWRMNNEPLSGGSIRGKSGINFKMPLGLETYIGVTIQEGSKVIGSKTIVVPAAQPEILFYEENLLRGTIAKTLDSNHIVSGNQITIRAVPFYTSPFFDNDNIELGWTLNGSTIDNSRALEENVLTLRGSGSQSRASIGFRLLNNSTIGQSIRSGFNLQFGQ